MSWNEPKDWTTGENLLEADLDEQVRDNLNFLKHNIALETPAELTISTGAVTKTQSHHSIAAESGTVDDLVTINAGADGEVLLLRAKTDHTITLKQTGNILNPLGEDVVVTDTNNALLIHNGTNWIIFASGLSIAGIQALIDASLIRTTTLTVAANDSLNKNADYVCDGTNDHIEIQAALDALPATGGEVKLLDGTYNCEVQIDLDSNQTLRGCGRNTILATSTTNLVFLSTIGGSGTEKTGIIISDLQIDGGEGSTSTCGIYFEYVDYSLVGNVYLRRHIGDDTYETGLYLLNSDFNQIANNTCNENGNGIFLTDSNNNTLKGNTCLGNTAEGMYLFNSVNNNVSINTCQGNGANGISAINSNGCAIVGNTCKANDVCGISFGTSPNCTVTGNICQDNVGHGILGGVACNIFANTCQGNGGDGLYLDGSMVTAVGNVCTANGFNGIKITNSNNDTIIGNSCIGNSQAATNTYDEILVESDSNYNNIQGNTCRAGGGVKVPRYGINIAAATEDGNLVANNDLYDDGFGTAPFLDDGTGTRYNLEALTERGSIIYRNATIPTELKHGTDGQVLTTKGDGADPIWATPAGGVTEAQVIMWAIVFS